MRKSTLYIYMFGDECDFEYEYGSIWFYTVFIATLDAHQIHSLCACVVFLLIFWFPMVFFVAKISNNGWKYSKEQGTRAKELTIRFIHWIALDEKALKTKIAICVSMRLKFVYLVVYGNAIQLTKATLQLLLWTYCHRCLSYHISIYYIVWWRRSHTADEWVCATFDFDAVKWKKKLLPPHPRTYKIFLIYTRLT